MGRLRRVELFWDGVERGEVKQLGGEGVCMHISTLIQSSTQKEQWLPSYTKILNHFPERRCYAPASVNAIVLDRD